MVSKFGVEAWSAFAPGLEADDDWRRWASAPVLPAGEAMPELREMAPMQRRRVEKLGRMALQVAWRCQPDGQDLPLLFASRHGDIARTFEMLTGLAAGEPLSPTHFGLSTHNAIAAQYSIARGLTGNYLALSAGAESVEAAVVEAQALLADGAPAVLVVCYDGPTPDAYGAFRDEPEAAYAWAWRLVPARAGLPVLALQAGTTTAAGVGGEAAESEPVTPRLLPHGLDVLRFFLAGDAELRAPCSGRRWTRDG
jgi:hypothetical protein